MAPTVDAMEVFEAPGDDQENFVDVFLNDWQLAVQRVDRGRRLMEVLQQFLKERATLEDSYSESLVNLSKRLVAPLSESSGIIATIDAARLDCVQRAQHSKEFAEALRTDIVASTLSSTIENHLSVLKQISNDATSLSRGVQAASAALQQGEMNLAKVGRQAYQRCLEAQDSSGTSSQVLKVTEKAAAALREYEKAAAHKKQLVTSWNQSKQLYGRQMSQILKALQDMDRKRICCTKDALRRLMIFQTSQLRNVQYDSNAAIQAIETLDEATEITSFILRSKDALGLSSRSEPTSSNDERTTKAALPADYVDRSWIQIYVDNGGTSGANVINDVSPVLNSSPHPIEAARMLMKKTPFNFMVQSAAAKLSNMSFTPQINEGHPSQQPLEVSPPCQNATEFLEWLGNSRLPRAIDSKNTCQEEVPNKAQYSNYIDMIWNFVPEMSEALMEGVNRLKDDFVAWDNRNLFLKCLMRKEERRQFRLPSMEALRVLGLASLLLLDWCDAQWDVAAVRCMIFLTQRIYAYGPNSADPQSAKQRKWTWPHKRVANEALQLEADSALGESASTSTNQSVRWYLHRAVYHHSVWSRVHLWEDIFTLSYRQEEQRKMVKKEAQLLVTSSIHETIEAVTSVLGPSDAEAKPQNVWAEQILSNFGRCMMSFGISSTHSRELIERMCEENSVPQTCVDRFALKLDNESSRLDERQLPLGHLTEDEESNN